MTERTCPRCGEGTLADILYLEGSTAAGEPIQEADTRQVEIYSCGHEVAGPSLAKSADGSGDLEVERRSSEETA